MPEGHYVFAQVMQHLPLMTFRRCVERYDGEHKVKRFSCLDQYLCLAFAQLTWRESLRDIEACLRSQSSKLYHLGFRSTIARNTLANANAVRDWRIYADFAQHLIGIARRLYADDPLALELDNSVYALDSTTIDLCLSVFAWAPFRSTKAAVKLHTLLDLRVRGKLKAMLANKRPDLIAPAAAWAKPWVIHINHWGHGHEAVLRYLARYVFRVAITNTRIVALDDHTVTIRYKERKSSRWRTCRMPGHEFVRRFLQHVLPRGLHKVRYFGLWHPSKRGRAAQGRLLLDLERKTPPVVEPAASSLLKVADQSAATAIEPRCCPCCARGHLVYIRRLTPKNALVP